MNPEQRINKIISEQLGVSIDLVTPDKSFVGDLGADSLDVVELEIAIEEEFEVVISIEDGARLHSIGDYHKYIADKTCNKNPSCFGRKLGVEGCFHGCPVSNECYKQ